MRTRQERRDDIRRRVEEQIGSLGRSLVCQAGNHERCKGGPKDHDTCLCECHDGDES